MPSWPNAALAFPSWPRLAASRPVSCSLFGDSACSLEGHDGLVVLSDLLEGVPQMNQGLHLAVRGRRCS